MDIFDSSMPDITPEKRQQFQADFGRHLVEQRNRMAVLVRKWIETDVKYPIPIYDRLLDHIRQLDPTLREEIASVALLMADQIVTVILATFARGDEMRSGKDCVNYVIIAQKRDHDSDEVIEEVDINRGEPVVAMWDEYKVWLNRHAPTELRPVTKR